MLLTVRCSSSKLLESLLPPQQMDDMYYLSQSSKRYFHPEIIEDRELAIL